MSDISLSWIAADAFHSTVSLTNNVRQHKMRHCHSSLLDSLNTGKDICASSVAMQIWIREINSLDLNMMLSVIGKQLAVSFRMWEFGLFTGGITNLIKSARYLKLMHQVPVSVEYLKFQKWSGKNKWDQLRKYIYFTPTGKTSLK